jgi:hypothetical protein
MRAGESIEESGVPFPRLRDQLEAFRSHCPADLRTYVVPLRTKLGRVKRRSGDDD